MKNCKWRKLNKLEDGRGSLSTRSYVEIYISKEDIPNIIKDKIAIKYKYPTKYGHLEGRCCILNGSKYGNAVRLENNDKYWLSVDKFIEFKIHITYDIMYYEEIDD